MTMTKDEQVFDDDRLEEIAEFIKDELGRVLGSDADSPLNVRIRKRYEQGLSTLEILIATMWALGEWQTNIAIRLATMDAEDALRHGGKGRVSNRLPPVDKR